VIFSVATQEHKRRQAAIQQEAAKAELRCAAAIKQRAVTEARRLTAELRARQTADEAPRQLPSQPAADSTLSPGRVLGGNRNGRGPEHDAGRDGSRSSDADADAATAAARLRVGTGAGHHSSGSSSAFSSRRSGCGQLLAGRLDRGQLRRSRSASQSSSAATILLDDPHIGVASRTAGGSGAAPRGSDGLWGCASVSSSCHQQPVGNCCSIAKQQHR
jgi:hypothetical protein